MLGALALPQSSLAIDNPDAKDYVQEFQDRISPYELRISSEAETTADFGKAYQAFERALDAELNRAYQALMSRLDTAQADQLKKSQRLWLAYRDAEFAFIGSNWTREAFGTSSVISRGAYRTQLIKDRVTALLHYLKNYE